MQEPQIQNPQSTSGIKRYHEGAKIIGYFVFLTSEAPSVFSDCVKNYRKLPGFNLVADWGRV